MNGENPRQIAIRILRQRERGGDYVEKQLENELTRHALSPPDRGLCMELVYGMIRWQATLDWLIARKTDSRKQNAGLRLLLQLGLYQIFWLQRIPNHAAVHETVELGKELGFGAQAGFLNAILRGYTRERETTLKELADLKLRDPALGHSHPAWLVERWEARWDRARTGQLLEWNNTPPPTFARLNLLKTDFATATEAWRQEGVEVEEQHWDWTGPNLVFKLKSHPPLPQLGSFQSGFFYVQDPSTLMAVKELDAQPGESILDLCAAPGGKTAYIAQMMRNEGKLDAWDSQPERLQLVRENCARLGITCAQFPEAVVSGDYDRILVDAPCSNTGVLRRRVDLRWRIQLDEITRLAQTQQSLLEQVAPLVKPGGILVYSTCSLEPEENEAVTKSFLEGHTDFKLERQRQLLPFADGVDGAYVARLRKTD